MRSLQHASEQMTNRWREDPVANTRLYSAFFRSRLRTCSGRRCQDAYMHQLLRILARAAVIVVIASLFPAKLHASDLWLDASYAKPLRWDVGAFLFFDHDDVQNRNGGRRIIVGGNVGPNGMQAWGGKALDLPGGGGNGGLELRAVVTR